MKYKLPVNQVVSLIPMCVIITMLDMTDMHERRSSGIGIGRHLSPGLTVASN